AGRLAAGDGADAGVGLGAPFGSKAIGDLANDRTRTQDLGPKSQPDFNPSGGAALNFLAQHGQPLPRNMTPVTSGWIGGISI
ncbi:MAG: hypothetical protein L0Y50_11015, partial [Beijerinckiaceae bacterium]|nr:hypothetical protein [Beijerinckiaceae bacterium]